jgi:hypothetical protein
VGGEGVSNSNSTSNSICNGVVIVAVRVEGGTLYGHRQYAYVCE